MSVRLVRLILALALCGLAGSQVLAADDIVLRAKVAPEDPWVGQKTVLQVDVLAKDGWAQLKKVGDVNIEGAHLLRLESQGTRLSETIDGESYTGQRYQLLVFTQRDGTFRIPSVPVDAEIRTWGAGAGTEQRRMNLPSLEFVARTPPGAEGVRGLISTTRLTANQAWEPEIDSPEVGDALTRTITLRAEEVSGMAFAPLRHDEIEGVGIYPGEPEVDDKFARGALSGTRIETVTYVFERPGDVEIPGIELSWWDVASEQLQRIEIPGQSIKVTGTLIADSEVAADAARPRGEFPVRMLLLAVLAVAVVLFFGRGVAARLARWRTARKEYEARYFRQVLRSARSGDQAMLLRATMRWLDRINNSPGPARLDEFLRQFGDDKSQASAAELFGSTGVPQDKQVAQTFTHGLAAARKRWLRAQRVRVRAAKTLPELNG